MKYVCEKAEEAGFTYIANNQSLRLNPRLRSDVEHKPFCEGNDDNIQAEEHKFKGYGN
jgi:hypothetical protein